MSPTIVAHAVNTDADTRSYLDHASRAALECLDKSNVAASEVHTLINVGIYRDSNIVEPAISALLQKRIGMGLAYRPGTIPAYSFDLLNGEVGLLNAIAVADAIFATDKVQYLLLTAGDTHPSNSDVPASEFPFERSGAAMLLGRNDNANGFGRIQIAADTGPVEPIGYVELERVGTRGREAMTISEQGRESTALAVEAIHKCVAAEYLDIEDVLVLVSRPSPDFAVRLAEALGLPHNQVVSVPETMGNPHTAALIHAYDNAVATGALDWPYSTVLFVAAGGPTAACVSYRP